MRTIACLVAAVGLLGGCARPQEMLAVKSFLLRDEARDPDEDPMVRMEKERRLRGAVSMEERRQRLGQYYTVIWNDSAGVGAGPVEVVFEYRQGGTGSRIKRMEQRFPATAEHGRAEFAVRGDDYFERGRVLAWRATVFRGGEALAVRRSFLWQ